MAQAFNPRKAIFTPLGTVEPYASLARPDFGQGQFKSDRGKYKVSLTIDADKAVDLMDLITQVAEDDFAERVAEYKANPPAVQRGKKPLLPYQGDLPFVDNGDGTVTFKFNSWADYTDKKTKEVVTISPTIVDSRGKRLPVVPNISGGSTGKVKFKIIPYGWNPTVGASVKLQLEGFMLAKLVEYGGGDDDWGDEAIEDGYVDDPNAKPAAARQEREPEPDYDGFDQGSDDDSADY